MARAMTTSYVQVLITDSNKPGDIAITIHITSGPKKRPLPQHPHGNTHMGGARYWSTLWTLGWSWTDPADWMVSNTTRQGLSPLHCAWSDLAAHNAQPSDLRNPLAPPSDLHNPLVLTALCLSSQVQILSYSTDVSSDVSSDSTDVL